MRRTTSITNMDCNVSLHSSPSSSLHHCSKHTTIRRPPMAPPPLSQVIGFNPTPGFQCQQVASCKRSPSKTVVQETPGETLPSQVTPRSTLQTLLTAAGQGTSKEDRNSQIPNEKGTGSKADTKFWQQNSPDDDSRSRSSSELNVKGSHKHKMLVVQDQACSALEPQAFRNPCSSAGYCFSTIETNGAIVGLPGQPWKNHQIPSVTTSLVITTDPRLLPRMSFLNSCYHCKRRLGQGRDTFMYRGDKAFCSVECRYQQILVDERKEIISSLTSPSSAAPSISARFLRSFLAAVTRVSA